MLDDQFCRRLAELRIKKGVSARDMSLSIGQSAGYINNIENGKNFPSMMGFFYIIFANILASLRRNFLHSRLKIP